MDVATRLMIGRPNKGPHFSVIHMAVGDISLYEKYHEPNDVKALCDNASGILLIFKSENNLNLFLTAIGPLLTTDNYVT